MPRKKKAKASLFEDEGVIGGDGGLTINSKFANSFEVRKRKQELDRAAELGLLPREGAVADGEEGSEESSEDEGEMLNPALDRKIFDVIHAIRTKDPKVYLPEVEFFAGDQQGASSASAAPGAEKKKAPKKGKSAQEVVAAQLMEAAEAGKEDAFEDDEELLGAHGRRAVDDGNRSADARMYDAEQRELRQAFLTSAARAVQGVAAGAGGEGEGDEELLKVKPKTKQQKAREEEEARVTREELLKAMATRKGGLAAHADEIRDPDRFLDTFLQSSVWRQAEGDSEGEEEVEEEEAAG